MGIRKAMLEGSVIPGKIDIQKPSYMIEINKNYSLGRCSLEYLNY